jgi:isocitrate dehydrogenase (NAD+)
LLHRSYLLFFLVGGGRYHGLLLSPMTVVLHEAVHGSAPDIADQNLANPTALLMSGFLMLDYIGERERAGRIRDALGRVLAGGRVRTRDLGGTATTTEFTDAVCREVEKTV